MTRVAFLWLLGSVTALFGIAALAMAMVRVRARRARRVDPQKLGRHGSPFSGAVDDADEADGDAIPSAAPSVPEDLAAICPTCGARYERERRLCARDSSRLAPLH